MSGQCGEERSFRRPPGKPIGYETYPRPPLSGLRAPESSALGPSMTRPGVEMSSGVQASMLCLPPTSPCVANGATGHPYGAVLCVWRLSGVASRWRGRPSQWIPRPFSPCGNLGRETKDSPPPLGVSVPLMSTRKRFPLQVSCKSVVWRSLRLHSKSIREGSCRCSPFEFGPNLTFFYSLRRNPCVTRTDERPAGITR